MLSRIGSRAARLHKKVNVPKAATCQISVRSQSSNKSWVPMSDEKLQQVTMKSLIAEVAEQQRELATKVVPWFLRNMPVSITLIRYISFS
jgi:hypothetical protein